jgi:hypothetical protein
MTTHDAHVLVLSDLVDPQEVVSLGKDSNFDGSRPENAMGTKSGVSISHCIFPRLNSFRCSCDERTTRPQPNAKPIWFKEHHETHEAFCRRLQRFGP